MLIRPLLPADVRYWLQSPAAVGLVYVAHVVVLRQVPVARVSFDKAGDDNEAQNHQVDAREDLVDQRWLVHAEGQKPWGTGGDGGQTSDFSRVLTYVGVFVLVQPVRDQAASYFLAPLQVQH